MITKIKYNIINTDQTGDGFRNLKREDKILRFNPLNKGAVDVL